MTQHEPTKGVSRRTAVKVAAWSVPTLALAVATPLAAASGQSLNVSIVAVCNTASFGPESRGFLVTVTAGTLPLGSTFTLTSSSTISVGQAVVGSFPIAVSALTSGSVTITTTAVFGPTDNFFVGIDASALSISVGTGFTLATNFGDINSTDNLAVFTAGIVAGFPGGLNICSL